MSRGAGAAFIPDRLPAISDQWSRWLRPSWFLLFAFALLADVAGAVYVVHDIYETSPAFNALGLNPELENDGSVTLGDPVSAQSRAEHIVLGSRIVGVEGAPVAEGALIDAVAGRLRAAHGPTVRVLIRDPDGGVRMHAMNRLRPDQAERMARDVRVAVRFLFAAISCLTLLACAVMLFARRPRDPVAMLISFSFLAMAASIDPPLRMWMATGLERVLDVLSDGWWLLLVIALATFPDGRFAPRWLKWVALAAVPIAPLLSIESISEYVQLVAAFGILLGVLVALPVRYRRLEPGIERQQIKWTAFGFAGGLTLIAAAAVMALDLPPDGTAWNTVYRLITISLFSLGFVLIPLGLMVSLIRFRLWEADRVISRSAAYAIVTVIVGIVWAASSDLVKELVASTMGQHNTAVATTASAIIAAGVFAPTQSVVLGWTERHFGKETDKLRILAQRLALWRNTESAAEMGMRALAVIADSVHASSAAILALTPTGRILVAARDVEAPEALAKAGALDGKEDPRFPLILPLEDADGEVGTLLLGPRSDGNRYNKDERNALTQLTEPLAEAIRFANSRAQREDGMQKMIISAVEERLAQLESGLKPKPA